MMYKQFLQRVNLDALQPKKWCSETGQVKVKVKANKLSHVWQWCGHGLFRGTACDRIPTNSSRLS